MNQLEQQISEYIGNILACSPSQAYSFENIYNEGLDSFSFVELISELERKYNIHFTDDELISGYFKNVAGIVKLIDDKKNKRP